MSWDLPKDYGNKDPTSTTTHQNQMLQNPEPWGPLAGDTHARTQTSTVQRDQTPLTSWCKTPNLKACKRGWLRPQTPPPFRWGGASFLSVLPKAGYPQNSFCFYHPSITKSIPDPQQDQPCLMPSPPAEEKAAVPILPQPSPPVTETGHRPLSC